jgi:hypothetical protein
LFAADLCRFGFSFLFLSAFRFSSSFVFSLCVHGKGGDKIVVGVDTKTQKLDPQTNQFNHGGIIESISHYSLSSILEDSSSKMKQTLEVGFRRADEILTYLSKVIKPNVTYCVELAEDSDSLQLFDVSDRHSFMSADWLKEIVDYVKSTSK